MQDRWYLMSQSVFNIQNGEIIGIKKTRKPKRKQPQFHEKQCNWCGKTYTPRVGHQLYCSPQCRKYSDQEHTLHRVRKFRKKYHNVLNQLSYQNLGTGGLGQHRDNDFEEEQRKIRQEMKVLGLN